MKRLFVTSLLLVATVAEAGNGPSSPQSPGKAPLIAYLGPLWGFSEFLLALFKRSKSNAVSKDRHSLGIIWLVYLAAISLAVWASFQLPSFAVSRPRLLRDIGAALFLAGMVLRGYAIIYLGRFFTTNVAIAADHRVIDTGPYRWIRHPSYTGGLLLILGYGLCFQNWASLVLVFVPCCAVTLWRIQIEEAALTGALGQAYEGYRRRTKRLIPLIW